MPDTHLWTWSESPDEPGVLLIRACAVDGVPGYDIYLKATERDIERMRNALNLRRLLR